MGVKNEIGNRYGKLTVIQREPNDKAGHALWLCQCDCGNTTIVRGTTLRAGQTQSCGCLQKEKAHAVGNNLIGLRFGRLTVIKQGNNNTEHRGKYWECICDCGNSSNVRGDQLISGRVQSCGCLQKEKAGLNKINEIGNKYGKLTVIAEAPSDNQGHAYWLCQCECGNTKICHAIDLRRGLIQSCGCIKSFKEDEIVHLLQKYNISFEQQYTFADLRTSRGGTPRFDFAIFKNNILYCVIEYQGAQHYDMNSTWYTEEYHARDVLKQNYCKEHNIQLLIWDKTTELEKSVKELL